MKIQGFHKTSLALATALIVASSTSNIFAQDTATPPVTAATPTTAPGLPAPVAQVLQLSQAKISDSTIVAFVQNSGTVYGLNADQIVYLKQQGVSETVIDAMLNQRSAMAAAAQTPPPAPQTTMPAQASAPDTTVAQPTTPAPSSVYVVPDTQTYNYNSSVYAYPNYYPYYDPYYAYYGWPVTFSFYGGRGGYWGGWHGGGWGGGWHGGGGGFHH